jgi:hypothetical protein
VIHSAIDIADLADDFTRNPSQLLGIPFALLGAVFLSLGAQLQHRGVAKVESSSGTDATSGLNVAQLLALLSRPSWVTGTVMLGLAILLFTTAVMTSATAPNGWTRVIGARDRLPSWSTIASPSMTVPVTQDGRLSSARS